MAAQILSTRNKDPFNYFRMTPEVIRLAVMFHIRFLLSWQNVERLLLNCGFDVSREAARCWCHQFNPMLAVEIRKRRIAGMKSSQWRTADHESEIPLSIVTSTRNWKAALKVFKETMRKHGVVRSNRSAKAFGEVFRR